MSTIEEIFTLQELEAYLRNKAFHHESWLLLRKIYDFCHKIRINLVGKQETHVSLQLMLLMKMADCLRVVQTASIFGYPHQAGMLCSSLWEMAHTIIYFSHTPEGVEKYIEASQDTQKKMPGLLGKKWQQICNENSAYMWSNRNANELKIWQEAEWSHYEKLCKIKHSHPFHINRVKKINEMEIEVVYGPYDYNDQGFGLMEVAREMILAMQCIVAATQNDTLKMGFADLVKEWEVICQKELSAQSMPGSSPRVFARGLRPSEPAPAKAGARMTALGVNLYQFNHT